MVYEIKSQLTQSYDLQYKAKQQTSSVSALPVQGRQDGILKQVFPQYLYNPAYGHPKRLNGTFLRRLSSNINVSSVLKTIKDEIVLTPWEIAVNKGEELSKEEEKELNEIEALFKNPNPDDTFDSWIKKVLEDLFVVEAGCYYNVLDRVGRIKQLRAVDGDSILKNPDIHGSFDSREGVITDFNNFLQEVDQRYARNNQGSQNSQQLGAETWKQLQSRYGTLYTSRAAYFQYNGAMAYSYPIPYGKDEMVYIQMNPSSYNVYTNGSPVSDAVDVILALSYSVKYHLDFYLNGNTPEGLISLAGGTSDDIENFKKQMKNATYTMDEQSGYERRMGYVLPIVNSDNAQFVPLTFNSKDMEILASQSLLNKLLWGRFGVTADEMGATENSNRATSKTQTDNAKRKAVLPILKILEDNFTKHTIAKYFKLGMSGKVKFKFKPDNSESELIKRDIWQKDVDLGIETWQTIAEKEGIDIGKLTKHKDDNFEKQQSQQPETQFNNQLSNVNKVNDKSESSPDKELKSNTKSPMEKVMDKYNTAIEKRISEIIKEN
ncbi:MAG TPA: hypothetical protein DCL21_03690 [Alphaproteobacteria bacterium]|nr:hypothetical protein [Alphaproteobacteria bacterium]